MNLKKLAGYAVLALILWWIITEPTAAAAFVHKAGTWIAGAAHGFSTFFASL